MSEKLMQPWEVPAAQPGAIQPWETPVDKSAPSIEQTMHPNFGVGERLLLKNFANSPEAMVAYLKKNHPEMDIQNYQGQIIGKSPNEKQYKTLDPSPSWNDVTGTLKDLPLDIADTGTDLAQGAASGIASAAAGAAGGAATLPVGGVGAIPSAMVAGGATNAGLEALKQKLGNYFGIPQEVSGKQVAIAGGAGAAAPLLFGTGAAAANLARPEAEQAVLNSAQRGLVPRGIDVAKEKVLPAMAEAVSGVPAESVKAYARNPEIVSQLKENGVTDYVEGVHNQLRSGLSKAKNQIGKNLEKEIDNAGAQVDLSKTKAIIDNHINSLETSELKDNPLIKQRLSELKSARDDLLTEVKPKTTVGPDGQPLIEQVKTDIPDKVSAKKAFELQALLNDQAEVSRLGQGTTPRFSNSMTPQEKAWAEANRKASQSINEELEQATGGMSTKLKGDYREYAQLQRDLNSRFSNPDATFNTLSNIHGKGKEMLRERLERVAELSGGNNNPMESANTLSAYKYFATPSKVPISSGGTTSTTRTGILGMGGYAAGRKMGGHLGGLQGAALANFVGSPAGVKAYTLAGKAMSDKLIQPALQTLPNQAQPGIPLALWQLLKDQQEQETP